MNEPEPAPPQNVKEGSAELLPLVYDELRKLAQMKMNHEHGVQTLSATALVHEAYLRISEGSSRVLWDNPRHFFGAAAEAMRRILIDRARSKNRIKRGGDFERVDFEESQLVAPAEDEELLAVDEALTELEKTEPESAELVKLRYFAGMTWPEISEATGIPDRTLRRKWSYAKAWLKLQIKG